MQKLTQLIAKCRKHLVVGFARASGAPSFGAGWHKQIRVTNLENLWPLDLYHRAISNAVDSENPYSTPDKQQLRCYSSTNFGEHVAEVISAIASRMMCDSPMRYQRRGAARSFAACSKRSQAAAE